MFEPFFMSSPMEWYRRDASLESQGRFQLDSLVCLTTSQIHIFFSRLSTKLGNVCGFEKVHSNQVTATALPRVPPLLSASRGLLWVGGCVHVIRELHARMVDQYENGRCFDRVIKERDGVCSSATDKRSCPVWLGACLVSWCFIVVCLLPHPSSFLGSGTAERHLRSRPHR